MTNKVKLEEKTEEDAEKRLVKYLRGLSKDLKSDRDYFCSVDNLEVLVHNPETFNKLAKSLEVHNLKFLGGRLGFSLYVPKDKSNHHPCACNRWTILLNGDSNNDFLVKYGGAYKID